MKADLISPSIIVGGMDETLSPCELAPLEDLDCLVKGIGFLLEELPH